MKLTVSHYAELLDEATSDANVKDLADLIAKFLFVVRKNRAWNQLPRIISAFETRVLERQGIARVSVRTPKPLTKTDEQHLAQQLGRDPKSIVWDINVDPSLVGGLQLQIGDTVVRGSVKDGIQSLSKQLST